MRLVHQAHTPRRVPQKCRGRKRASGLGAGDLHGAASLGNLGFPSPNQQQRVLIALTWNLFVLFFFFFRPSNSVWLSSILDGRGAEQPRAVRWPLILPSTGIAHVVLPKGWASSLRMPQAACLNTRFLSSFLFLQDQNLGGSVFLMGPLRVTKLTNQASAACILL